MDQAEVSVEDVAVAEVVVVAALAVVEEVIKLYIS